MATLKSASRWLKQEEKIDEYCGTLAESRDCLNYALGNCPGISRISWYRHLSSKMKNARKVEEEMCTEGHPVREGILKPMRCINSKANQELIKKHCSDPANQFLKEVFRREGFSFDKDRNIFCCSSLYDFECRKNLIISNCGETTAHYFTQVHKSDLTPSQCDERWIYAPEECAAVIPQSLAAELVIRTSPIEKKKCDSEYVNECYLNYSNSVFNLEHPYLWNYVKEDLDATCRMLEKSRDCLIYALENCHSTIRLPLGKDDLLSDLNHTIKKVETEMCSEGHPVRERHLKHGRCIRQNVSQELVEQRCVNSTSSFLSEMIPEGRSSFNVSIQEDLRILCCTSKYVTECLRNHVLGSCGDETARYFMGENKDFVTVKECDENLTYGSEECAAVIPQSLVDKLGLVLGAETATSSMVSLVITSLLAVLFGQCTV